MVEYQPFPITTLKTGMFTYLEPWIRPEDAFEPSENAQVYRGTLQKRYGYSQLGNTLADGKPVMGIMRYQNETTGVEALVVATTNNLYLYDPGSNTFNLVTGIVGSFFWEGAVPAAASTIPLVGTTSLFFPNLTAGTVVVQAFFEAAPTVVVDQVTDNGVGGWGAPTTGTVFTGAGTVNYTTGAVSFGTNLGAPNTVILRFSATTTGNYFSGTIQNFFNWTNWQPTDPKTFISSTSYLYMTNNKDPVTLFDGTSLSRPIYYVDNLFTDYVTTTFDVKVFTNRLLFILPSLNSTTNPLNQTIFWSALFNPFDFISNISGHGGQLSAATADLIENFTFLRNICIVRMTRSAWIFRYTGNDFNPFVFQKINNTKNTNCPYAGIEYDERTTGIGNTGITACDGVNMQRFDISIIDFFETEMSEDFYSQAFSQRYDNNNQSWTLYVSQSNTFEKIGGLAPGSDKALIYNFVENTWSTNKFSRPLTCLGLFHIVTGKTWASLNVSPKDLWQNQDVIWASYSYQKSAPTLLSGDTTGHIYFMDDQETSTDNGALIVADIISTRWNPFIKIGQKVQFGWIDFYYKKNPDCFITLTFYVDNSESSNAVRTLTLDGNGTDSDDDGGDAMKRIYINAMGEFLKMEMTSNSQATFQINGLILWCRPAGRLTP